MGKIIRKVEISSRNRVIISNEGGRCISWVIIIYRYLRGNECWIEV